MRNDERPPSPLGKAASILLALLPPARMAWIVFRNGENNLSNDYIARVPLVASMLEGTCTVARFVRGAWVGASHSLIALVPIYYFNARFFNWSVWVELGLGLALVAATIVLLAGAIPLSMRWVLLPLLSLLLFSTARVTVFTFGEPSLQYGLSQLGVAIAAFALVRWGQKPVSLAVALTFAGVLASWSWGGGIMVWPAFLGVLVLARVRGIAVWALLAAGAAIGLAQYAWLLPQQLQGVAAGPVSWALKGRLFLDIVGRPLVNGIANAEPDLLSQILGAAGLVTLALTLTVLRRELRAHLAATLLVSWALLVALEIALVRAGVAPWYVSPMALFWVGLLLLLGAAPAPFRAVGIGAVALLALRVQHTWEDKSFYLPSRSPASAACLREYRFAPAACHARVFQWGDGGGIAELAALGEPLERRGLSVFGPSRTYLLQGDVPLGRVRFEPESAPSFFSNDGRTRGDINDFRRLDLVLAPGGSVSWRVDLPPRARRATFSTVVRAAPGDPQLARGARVSVTVEGSPVLLEERAFLLSETARPLSVDLSSLAGKHVTLRLEAEERHEGETPLVFAAPRVLVTVDP